MPLLKAFFALPINDMSERWRNFLRPRIERTCSYLCVPALIYIVYNLRWSIRVTLHSNRLYFSHLNSVSLRICHSNILHMGPHKYLTENWSTGLTCPTIPNLGLSFRKVLPKPRKYLQELRSRHYPLPQWFFHSSVLSFSSDSDSSEEVSSYPTSSRTSSANAARASQSLRGGNC